LPFPQLAWRVDSDGAFYTFCINAHQVQKRGSV
jgi:hypothetical protein